MFYCQAPDVQVITDRGDDIVNEATVYSKSEPTAEKDEGDLVDIISKSAGPQSKFRTQAVDHCKCKRSDKNVLIREFVFDQMSGDHLANRVGIYEASVEDEWEEVVTQDDWLQGKIGGNQDPGDGDW